MSKKPEKPPVLTRPPETFNYLGKFTLNKGDKVRISSQSYYVDASGKKRRAGVSGTYIFVCAVSSGILVKEKQTSQQTTFIYLGEERSLELTGTTLKPHILKLPVKPKGKKNAVHNSTKS